MSTSLGSSAAVAAGASLVRVATGHVTQGRNVCLRAGRLRRRRRRFVPSSDFSDSFNKHATQKIFSRVQLHSTRFSHGDDEQKGFGVVEKGFLFNYFLKSFNRRKSKEFFEAPVSFGILGAPKVWRATTTRARSRSERPYSLALPSPLLSRPVWIHLLPVGRVLSSRWRCALPCSASAT